jgi:membrane-associated protein
LAEHILELLRSYLAQYGYGAVAIALLLENAGLPVPGETILLLASFHAFSEHRLRLPYIMLVAVAAATAGDSLGFAIGYYGGRPLLDRYQKALRIKPAAIAGGEQIFARYGAATVFFARFVAGLRVIAGPLAGVLRMPWRRFVIFNFLGATVWVTVISSAGYLFGKHWERFSAAVTQVNTGLLVAAAAGVAVFWWRRRRTRRH